MKKIILIFITFLIANVGYTQADWTKTGISKMIEDYATMVNKGEWINAFLEYTHPVLFDLAPKEVMIEQMEKMLNDPEMQIKMSHYKLKEIGKLISYKDDHYAIVKMSFTMTMTFKKAEEDGENTDELGNILDITAAGLRGKYGKENIKIDKASNSLIIHSISNTLAIGEKEIGSWKMLEYKKEQLKMFGEDFIPKKVQKKLNKQLSK